MPKTNNHTNAKAPALSILIHQCGLSFLIYDPNSSEVNELKHHAFPNELPVDQLHEEVKAKLTEGGVLDRSFSKVSVCVSNPLSAFVPDTIFDGTQMDTYLQHHVDLRPSDFITHDRLDNLNTINVYVPFVNVNNMLLDAFGRFSYFHASSVLLSAMTTKHKKTEKHSWVLHIETGLAYCMVYKKGNLIFYNAFSWTNEEDLLYYTLAVRKSHKLTKTTLWLSGKTSKDDPFQKLLSDYHESIEIMLPNHHLDYKKIKLLHPQQHLLLLETPACAS